MSEPVGELRGAAPMFRSSTRPSAGGIRVLPPYMNVSCAQEVSEAPILDRVKRWPRGVGVLCLERYGLCARGLNGKVRQSWARSSTS